MDNERFARALEAAAARERAGIGTLGEKGVHNTLKHYYEPDISCHEIPIGGYVADIVGENGIIEIQTSSFFRMREKLTQFLEHARVTIVWPCVVNKRLIRIDCESGEVISMRRSNLHKGEYDVFRELYGIRQLISDPRLSICIAQLEADEYRPSDMKRGRKHRGANNGVERYPTALVGEIILSSPSDYLRFIPAGLPEEFTSKDLAKKACITTDTARCALGVLAAVGAVKRTGMQNRTYLYRTVSDNFTAESSSEASPSERSLSEAESCSASRTEPFDHNHIKNLLQQPLDGLDGHLCAAIISGASLSEVLSKTTAGRWSMSAKKLQCTLDELGVAHSGLHSVRKPPTALPECCIISEHGHFLLHYRGIYYDNTLGIFELYDQSRMTGYIEIYISRSDL